MAMSAYASSAVCAINSLGTSPYGIIDALDPFESFWPGTEAISNLTKHPHGDYQLTSVRYSCTPCAGEFAQTAHVASSLDKDACMLQCSIGSQSLFQRHRGLRPEQSLCLTCRLGAFAADAGQSECTACTEGYTTPDLGATFAWYCYRAELHVERIWRMGQDVAVQFEWRVYPPQLARTDDMVAIHSGALGRRQLAWAYTSAPSGGPSQQEHKTQGSNAVSIGSHTLYFESAGAQTYHLRFSSLHWADQYINSKVLFASLAFRLEGHANDAWLTAGACADGEDNELCIPEDTGQQILEDGLLCANGAIARQWDFTKCPPCPRGEAGSVVCAPCGIATYADEVGLPECKECKRGWVANKNGTFCDGEACCIPCSEDTRNLPQCALEDETTGTPTTTPAATTTPAPTTTAAQTIAKVETTQAIVETTPPPQRDGSCGDGERNVALDNGCWTSAFSGLQVSISASAMTQCPSDAVSEMEGVFFAAESTGGDGRYHMPEECDDGNPYDGDGCSSKCFVEAHWKCAPAKIVTDGSVVSDRCSPIDEPSVEFFRSLAPLEEGGGVGQGNAGGAGDAGDALDWYSQMTGVDGLLQLEKYKIPGSHCPRESGWFQAHLAATGNKFRSGQVCVNVGLCVYVCMCIHMCMHLHSYALTYVCMHIYAYACIYRCMCTHM